MVSDRSAKCQDNSVAEIIELRAWAEQKWRSENPDHGDEDPPKSELARIVEMGERHFAVTLDVKKRLDELERSDSSIVLSPGFWEVGKAANNPTAQTTPKNELPVWVKLGLLVGATYIGWRILEHILNGGTREEEEIERQILIDEGWVETSPGLLVKPAKKKRRKRSQIARAPKSQLPTREIHHHHHTETHHTETRIIETRVEAAPIAPNPEHHQAVEPLNHGELAKELFGMMLKQPQKFKGERGAPGKNGARGASGSDGLPGDRGPQGLTGRAGKTGRTGRAGPRGPRGHSGSDGGFGMGTTGSRSRLRY